MSTYNPAGIGLREIRLMPKGARLLESDEERLAFIKLGTKQSDMFVWLRYACLWMNGCTGYNPSSTYCTTRERGWWRVSTNVDDTPLGKGTSS